MNLYQPSAVAAAAVPAGPGRPAVAMAHDHDDARLVVFRIEPGQQVATHTTTSSVFLTVISGAGFVTGSDGERAVGPGAIAAFAPREPHGMRAGDQRLVVAAFIAPRPGSR